MRWPRPPQPRAGRALGPGAVGQQAGGQVHGDGDALLGVAVAAQADGDAVPLGEAADHEQAHATGGVRGDVATVRELVVEGGEVLGRHTEATVGDLDEEATFGRAGTTDVHAGRGRGVGQRVVDDLRDQVDEVGADRTEHVVVGGVTDVDALVVLDLGDRGADGVGDRDRAGEATTGRGAGEDEQRVAVAAHTGGEVVEAEQALQPLRVLLVALEALDEAELLVDERGAATRQRLEHVPDLDPEAGLVTGEGEGLAVQVVHGAGELTHLLGVCTGIGTNAGGSSPSRMAATASGSRLLATSRAPWRTARIGTSRERSSASTKAEGGQQGHRNDGGVEDRVAAEVRAARWRRSVSRALSWPSSSLE